jgi:PAS domain S-box-containing protein
MSTLLHASLSFSPVVVEPSTPERAQALLHELQVHQIELKMQNEALREAQVALEESRDRYLNLYEFAPVGYLTLNVHGLIEDINLTGTKLLNRERNRLLKTRFAQYVVPADQSGWQRFFRQALRNGDELTGEVELKRNGDDRLVVTLKCAAILTDGVVTAIRITLSNITALKHALTDLQVREDRLQLAKAASDLGLFDDDLVSGKHIFDQRLREIWGFGVSEPVSFQHILEGVHPDDRKAAQACLEQALNPRGKGNCVAQFRVIHRRDGTLHHVAANGQVFFKNGRAARFVGTVKDVSERVRLEAELQERRNAMELLVHQQIATQTAAAIAHDINQPLVAISAYSEAALQMLRGGVTQPHKLMRALEGAAQQAQRAGRSLHELLDFLHHGEAVTEALDLNQVVAEAIRLADLGSRGAIDLVFEPRLDLPAVQINRLQIQKVIVNLLQNSCDAMRTASAPPHAISITASPMAAAPMVQVSVQDSGPGFTLDSAKHALEPFFTTKTHGIGLGLAISQALIEANGGQLWIEPPSGAGATLHFSLPFAS